MTKGIFESVSAPPAVKPEQLVLVAAQPGQVIDEQHRGRAMLEGVGGLVAERRVFASASCRRTGCRRGPAAARGG